jgi:Aldehyde dehydrogenase family
LVKPGKDWLNAWFPTRWQPPIGDNWPLLPTFLRASLLAASAVRAAGSRLAVPFGGVKLSGFGRDKSRHSLEEYTYLKSTWIRYA